ncbi:hypothetical protein KGF57_003137 [Candida theae]|uniref:Uncharacterized protein n=1 Tax=Candida theae TaxID=1198502 RepID=A0AAD5FY49_9ASCO|nr:uncharacterized protein KGF57_003137 [Candida theae]KAI5957443.1 hypothetical protein KGF57_003137 [Candida theae]
MNALPSLKQLIASNGISPPKMKQFGIIQERINNFVDVAQMPNATTYANVPNLVAKDGTVYKLDQGGFADHDSAPDLLTSHPGSEASQFSEIVESTLQTSQEMMMSSEI